MALHNVEGKARKAKVEVAKGKSSDQYAFFMPTLILLPLVISVIIL